MKTRSHTHARITLRQKPTDSRTDSDSVTNFFTVLTWLVFRFAGLCVRVYVNVCDFCACVYAVCMYHGCLGGMG